jgi:hypothetical protein
LQIGGNYSSTYHGPNPSTKWGGSRRNRTIIERACSIAYASQRPGFLWTELNNTATYLINISPTRSNNGNTPDQLYYQTLPRVDHLRIFGSICYLHVPEESCSKLESKTKQCFFLGYNNQSKAYRVYDLVHKCIHISRDFFLTNNKLASISYNLPYRYIQNLLYFQNILSIPKIMNQHLLFIPHQGPPAYLLTLIQVRPRQVKYLQHRSPNLLFLLHLLHQSSQILPDNIHLEIRNPIPNFVIMMCLTLPIFTTTLNLLLNVNIFMKPHIILDGPLQYKRR